MRLSLERIRLCLKHLSAAHSVFTLPLVGRVGAKRRGGGRAVIRRRTPTPSPSPQGGGEHTEFVARAHSVSHELALFALAIIAVAGTTGAASAQVPPAIAAPGESAVVTLHAEGAQVYECKAGSDGKLAWAFREPIATLLLDGKTVGRHYAGPNWEHVDGSAVVGKAVANVAGKTPSDIPWLKLEVTAHRGSGTLSGVTTVQRINTQGGVHAGACDKAGALHSAPYAGDYVFLKKGS
jgi:uncharacterized protein DUF3455